jgi:hypothetical protein
MESTTNDTVLLILSPTIFGGPEEMMDFLNHRGNPKYHILEDYYIAPHVTTLGSLVAVTGGLFIDQSKLSDFGNLKTITGSLILKNTSLSEKYTKEEIKGMIDIGGEILIIK